MGNRTLRDLTPEAERKAPAEKDNLRYAVVPIEWLRAVQPLDLKDRPRAQSIPADMVEALEELLAAAKAPERMTLDQELALRAAAWPAPVAFDIGSNF